MGVTPILELLGIPQLRLPDGTTVELRQKAFALAALLHIEYRGRARRQVVSDRLWETASATQASTNLRQVLLNTRGHEGRHGFELFDADATYVALNASVRLDLVEIQAIRGVTEPAEFLRLLGLYRAGLLEGLTGSAEELERWIETERTRIENQFVAAATATALRIGGSVAEPALARLAEIQPFSDQVCQAQMRLARESRRRTRRRVDLRRLPQPALERAGGRTRARDQRAAQPAADRSGRRAKAMPQAEPGPVFPAESARVPRIVLLPPLQEFGRSVYPQAPCPGPDRGRHHQPLPPALADRHCPALGLAVRSVLGHRRNPLAPDRLCRREPRRRRSRRRCERAARPSPCASSALPAARSSGPTSSRFAVADAPAALPRPRQRHRRPPRRPRRDSRTGCRAHRTTIPPPIRTISPAGRTCAPSICRASQGPQVVPRLL